MADIAIRQQSPTAFYIKVDPTDNVAIIVNDRGLTAGTRFPDGLTLVEHIPQGHKVALVDIPAHGEIIRYGEVIGYAVRDIPQGSWIDESLVELPTAPPLNTLPLATKVPEPLPPLEGYTFEGYRNADGSVGTKNLLGITTSVHCVAGVVDYVVKIIERDLLPNYPNVDGVVGLNHLYGCGVAINAPAAVVPIRTIHNIALNPNFGGEVMVIGLGCEKLQPERLLQGTEDVKSIPVDSASIVSLQDEKHVGFKSMVDDILQVAERHLAKLNQRQRETCPASELVVGMQCGGSDAFSGVTANPAVGYASDLLVRCGATVMFSEVTEVRDAIHLLTPRAINEEVGKRLLEEMAWYDNYLDMGKTDRSANPSPGNKAGGLTCLEEKSLGCIHKGGHSPVMAVYDYAKQVEAKQGLVIMDTPGNDPSSVAAMVAGGAQIVVFSTGRGTPTGNPLAPVIKITGNKLTYANMIDNIDVDASPLIYGTKTIEELGQELLKLTQEVACGKQTKAESLGYTEMAIARVCNFV